MTEKKSKKPDVKITSGPSGSCPVQAEGTINNRPFYFRARGTDWALHVAMKPTQSALARGSVVYKEKYKGSQPSAGNATPDECRQFIWKAAEILLTKTPTQEP